MHRARNPEELMIFAETIAREDGFASLKSAKRAVEWMQQYPNRKALTVGIAMLLDKLQALPRPAPAKRARKITSEAKPAREKL